MVTNKVHCVLVQTPTEIIITIYSFSGAHTGSGGLCPTGYYCEEGSELPEGCPAGTYQDEEGQSSCKDCPAGE